MFEYPPPCCRRLAHSWQLAAGAVKLLAREKVRQAPAGLELSEKAGLAPGKMGPVLLAVLVPAVRSVTAAPLLVLR